MRALGAFLCLGFFGCVSAADLAGSSSSDADVITQECTAVVEKFAQCGTTIGCAFDNTAVTACESALAKEPTDDISAIVNSPCDEVIGAICADSAYSKYCTCP